jgi:hypothetical protein
MNIANFDDLLNAARYDPLPQRLLFVFAGVDLPEGASPQQRADYEAGYGGALTPLMCVDKSPQELDSFAALAAEADLMGQKWAMLFAAAMSGPVGNPPTSIDAEVQLQRMVEAVKSGDIDGYIPFDSLGVPMQLNR